MYKNNLIIPMVLKCVWMKCLPNPDGEVRPLCPAELGKPLRYDTDIREMGPLTFS